jgi:hypothetical protein
LAFAKAYTVFASLKLQFTNRVRALAAPDTGAPADHPEFATNAAARAKAGSSCFLAKSAYMWRDIERRAGMYGIPVKLPAPYPAKESAMANLVAIVGIRESWGADYVRAAFTDLHGGSRTILGGRPAGGCDQLVSVRSRGARLKLALTPFTALQRCDRLSDQQRTNCAVGLKWLRGV